MADDAPRTVYSTRLLTADQMGRFRVTDPPDPEKTEVEGGFGSFPVKKCPPTSVSVVELWKSLSYFVGIRSHQSRSRGSYHEEVVMGPMLLGILLIVAGGASG